MGRGHRRRRYRPAAAPAYATNAPQGPAAILEAMRKVIDSVQKDAAPAQRAVIEQELAAAHAAIRARLVRAADGYAIAAGAEHGQYLRFAQALSDETAARTVPLITRGGEENLRLLRTGKVSLALAQGDVALDAYEGKGNFGADGPHAALQAVGSLYPEPVHVLVRRGCLRLGGGPSRPAGRGWPAGFGLAHHGAARAAGPRARPRRHRGGRAGIGDALVALRQKNVDAVMQVIGVPADSVRDALTAVSLRLLPLSAQAVAARSRSAPAISPTRFSSMPTEPSSGTSRPSRPRRCCSCRPSCRRPKWVR